MGLPCNSYPFEGLSLVESGVASSPVPGTAWGLFLQSHLISSTVVRSGYYYTHFTETKTETLTIHYSSKNHAIHKPEFCL